MLSQAALLKILPKNISPAQVRSALTKVLKRQFSGNQNFSAEGWLLTGLNGYQTSLSENDINSGSIYMCCAVFLALGLKLDDAFWTEPACEWTTVKAWSAQNTQKDQSIDF